MSYVTTKDGVEIFYKDWGPKSARPVVFHHGWPLSADDWDAQMLFFLSHAPAAEQHRFVAEVERRFAELPRALRARFDPVARGLALAVRGERLDQRTLDRGGAQRFLGWCVGAHPQME